MVQTSPCSRNQHKQSNKTVRNSNIMFLIYVRFNLLGKGCQHNEKLVQENHILAPKIASKMLNLLSAIISESVFLALFEQVQSIR